MLDFDSVSLGCEHTITYNYQFTITPSHDLLSGTFGLVFVDQSFWQLGAAAKPSHSVWGFITGGLVWFALAFVASYALGLAYLAFSVMEGYHVVSNHMAEEGKKINYMVYLSVNMN